MTPVIGKELPLQRELTNNHDVFAVGVMKDRVVVGHVPIELSFGFCTFIQSGGDISKFKAKGNTNLIDKLKQNIKVKKDKK